jgi:anti-anti-sigma factor
VISVTGQLDAFTEPAFRERTEAALAQPDVRLLFDLTELSFIDSAGLRVILDAYAALGRGDRVAVCGLIPHIQSLFNTLGLTGRIFTYPTLADALRYSDED